MKNKLINILISAIISNATIGLFALLLKLALISAGKPLPYSTLFLIGAALWLLLVGVDTEKSFWNLRRIIK